MFKTVRWRSEKNKIKAVFKLQFQATKVPQLGGTTLTISLVPADVGKPTVRLEKTAVQDGTCTWENPIYETVKFTRKTKTGKINEKIYHFIVSTGSSKAGFLGEVCINLADYAESIKPSFVSLPLMTSNSGAVLHVTIQKMHEAVDQRHVEENGGPTVKSQLSNRYTNGKCNHNSTEDGHLYKTTSQDAERNGSFRISSSSNATLASRWNTSSGQNTPEDFGLKNFTIHQDPTSLLSPLRQNSMPQKATVDAVTTKLRVHRRSNTDWSVGSPSDGSIVDSTDSPEDNVPRERLQEASEITIERFKTEIFNLERQAEVSEMELQSLRKQFVKESKRGQDLSRQIVSLKEERDALKTECKSFQKCLDESEVSNTLQNECEDLKVLLNEIRQELNYEKNLNTTLRLQLQKTQDSNSELILVVRDLDEMLEQKNKEMSHISRKIKASDSAEEVNEKVFECKMNQDEDRQSMEELIKDHNDAKEVDLLKQKIIDLYGEIDVDRKDNEEREMHMEQLVLDHENLKQENHDLSSKLEQNLLEQMETQNEFSSSLATIKELESQVERLEKEIKKQAREFSESLDTVHELETKVKSLEKELEKKTQGFEDDLEAITSAKVEQEQRAIRAEEALRKTRWNNANAAERLQEEFRRVSVEMASKFDENEKVATKALTEANELHLQKRTLEEMLQKAIEELGLIKDQYEVKLRELSNQIDLKAKQIEQMSLELEDQSKQLECAKKNEEEKHGAFSKEIQMLRAEIERLTREKYDFSEEAEQKEKLRDEMEQMKKSIGEREMMIQRWSKEKEELERQSASARKEAETSREELNNMKSLKDEKETMIGILQSEMENLRAQYSELKHSLFEEELEKENLKKQVFQLKGDLRKKEEAIPSIQKELKINNGQATTSDIIIMTSRNNESVPLPCDSKEVANLKEKLKLFEEQIKLKEAALENSTNSFQAKENDLSNKIEELESSMEQLNHSICLCANQFQKEAGRAGNTMVNASKTEERRDIMENSLHYETSTTVGKSVQNGVGIVPVESELETCPEKEVKVSTYHTSDGCNLTELLTEVAVLKERNKSMEGELKEMQARYSEISLKFAEVEGERQQLVMTVRNLKNGKKN